MGFLIPVVAIVLLAFPAFAADKNISLFLNGGKVETVIEAVEGRAELVLPAAALPGTLRIKPAAGDLIDRVEIVPVRSDPKQAQQLERFEARREQLEDRLKALATREQIFTAAAKSQSGKAPRKTKANPEPMVAIRQGTDFAIAQLEAVYQAKRKAEKELKQVEIKLETAKKAGNIGGSLVSVWMKGRRGKATVSYFVDDLRWTPRYDFRVNDQGAMVVVQRASFPVFKKGTSVTAVPGLMGDAAKPQPISVAGKSLPEIARQSFAVENLVLNDFPRRSATFSVTNKTAWSLPAGEALCYVNGEYLGQFGFAGLAEGKTMQITCGK